MPLPRRSLSRSTLAALAGAAVVALTPLATEAAEITPPKAEALIEQLAVDSFADREVATEQLVNCELDIEPLVTARIRSGEPLSPEQLLRLETILRTRFESSPRAALGIGFLQGEVVDNVRREIAVTISSVEADFPCAATLKPGDIIRVVDGVELPPTGGNALVQSAILSHLPGEEVELVIERDGRRSFVRIPLANFIRLSSNPPPPTLVSSGWELRRARLGLAGANETVQIQCVADGERGVFSNLPKRAAPEITAGGSPDNGAELMHLLRSRASTVKGKKIAATNNNRRIAVRQPEQRLGEKQIRADRAVLKRLNTDLSLALNERDRYQRILNRDDVGQIQKQSTIAALTQVEARIADIKSEIRAITDLMKQAAKDAKDADAKD